LENLIGAGEFDVGKAEKDQADGLQISRYDVCHLYPIRKTCTN
jgi:hypothetical protein